MLTRLEYLMKYISDKIADEYKNLGKTFKDWKRMQGICVYFDGTPAFSDIDQITLDNMVEVIDTHLQGVDLRIVEYIKTCAHQNGFLNLSETCTKATLTSKMIGVEFSKKRFDFIKNADGSVTYIERYYLNDCTNLAKFNDIPFTGETNDSLPRAIIVTAYTITIDNDEIKQELLADKILLTDKEIFKKVKLLDTQPESIPTNEDDVLYVWRKGKMLHTAWMTYDGTYKLNHNALNVKEVKHIIDRLPKNKKNELTDCSLIRAITNTFGCPCLFNNADTLQLIEKYDMPAKEIEDELDNEIALSVLNTIAIQIENLTREFDSNMANDISQRLDNLSRHQNLIALVQQKLAALYGEFTAIITHHASGSEPNQVIEQVDKRPHLLPLIPAKLNTIPSPTHAEATQEFKAACKNLSDIAYNDRSWYHLAGRELLHTVRQVRPQTMSVTELTALTTSINDAADVIKNPAANISKYITNAKNTIPLGIGRRWGKVVTGALFGFLGVAIVATAATIAVATFGAAIPLSIAGLTLGGSIISAAIMISLASTAGFSLVVTSSLYANDARKGKVAIELEEFGTKVNRFLTKFRP